MTRCVHARLCSSSYLVAPPVWLVSHFPLVCRGRAQVSRSLHAQRLWLATAAHRVSPRDDCAGSLHTRADAAPRSARRSHRA
eukprot:3246314-Pleurochrysis_carterae.AAC.1